MITIAIAALLGFAFKIVLDIRSEHQNMIAVAAGLAGELGAYMRLSQPEQIIDSIRKIAAVPRENRVQALRGAFSNLPSGHPVFDQIADKIGVLTPQAARGISEAYNIFTSARLMLANFSTEPFLDGLDHVQVAHLNSLANMIEQELNGVRVTVALLDLLSRQNFPAYVNARYWPR